MNFVRLQLLHWCHDIDEISRKFDLHDHPYWQLEIVISGRIMVHDGNESFQLMPGCFWLLPPQSPHTFLKEAPPSESYSFKFAVEDDDTMIGGRALVLRPDNYFIHWLSENLLKLVDGETQGSLIANRKKETLEYLLLDVLHYAHRETLRNNELPEIVAQLREMVLSRGKIVNVEFAAAELNISVSRLKYLFSQAVKDGDTSVKKFIDQTCLELIENYLKYSDFSIGRIAETTGFPDIYALSRFYTRLRGYPPSHFKPV